ncbi:MAG: FlgD immunoglobulin-like domain containing protein [Candidatus Zixiibacteriota bacterium]
MKQSLAICCVIVVVCAATGAAADSVAVRLFNAYDGIPVMNGAVLRPFAPSGTPILYRLELSIENETVLEGISLGFAFTGDAGLGINWEPQPGGWGENGQGNGFQAITIVNDIRLDPSSDGSFDLGGLLIFEDDIDSVPPDKIILGGASLNNGLATGPMQHMLNYYFTLTNNGPSSLTFAIDSAKVGNAGEFVFSAGIRTYRPGFSGRLQFAVQSASDVDDNGNQPDIYSLAQNTPNPFNPTTRIDYSLARRGDVSIIVFNILGQKVKTLVDGEMDAGQHTVYWKGEDAAGNAVASGMYFYKMMSGEFVTTRKMILVR